LREILAAAERAAKLTKQLLAFSRKQVMQPEVLDVVEVVKNLQGMLERLLGNSHKLVVESVGGLPAVKADRGQIEQVILNLVVNARDAMPEGGSIIISAQRVERAQVQASWGHLESDGKVLMLAVSDQGTGISPEVKSSLFQPYFTTKAEGKGTGLGLSTVYGIVQQSGGAIGLDSEVGKGSTFKIYLMGLEGGIAPEPEKKPLQRARLPHHGTILVAEDDLQIGDVVKQGLESRGFKVLLVNEASSALRIIRDYQGPLDLLLTDVMMPGMNGRMLAEEAVAMRPQMKVLFMSGFAADESLHITIAKLKADVILKPFSPESLHQKMCDVMQIESEVTAKAG
jgi:CheY-like chemotaxis protein